jgi:threonine dehydrogenase-like Zn-dependent dehydrogenase
MDGLVSHRFPLERIDEAFQALRDKPEGFVKAVVTFPEG